ncbi:sensor histidine kinase [Paenibacillus sp. RC67]|uniref:sensor histidine kinase n=1 Tax=Paenibacillus sp. RC67 TaxID=3039392 RepID=UPI0024AE1555|nr:sensor histidine kinase [Paenibacillus sp. RC67]
MFKKEGQPFNRGMGVFQMIWLVYLASPIYNILQLPVREMWIGLALLFVFVVATLCCYFTESKRLLFILLMMAIIVFFCLRYDLGFWFMGFYAAPVIGLLRSRVQFFAGLGIMAALFIFLLGFHLERFSGSELVIILPSSALMFGLPFILRAGVKSRELRARLNSANEEIARLVKNEERQRISRDLHDTLGHTLSLITLKSELAEKLIVKNPERAIKEVKDIQMTARAALKQVRELVSGINAVSVKDEIRHTEQLLAAAMIELEAVGDFGGVQASPIIQNILGMCLREAINNVVKHSKATRCKVELMEDASQISIAVSDNGVGAQCPSPGTVSSGRGLLGMKERLDLIDGKLEFHSSGESGTRVTMTVNKIVKNQQAEGEA